MVMRPAIHSVAFMASFFSFAAQYDRLYLICDLMRTVYGYATFFFFVNFSVTTICQTMGQYGEMDTGNVNNEHK